MIIITIIVIVVSIITTVIVIIAVTAAVSAPVLIFRPLIATFVVTVSITVIFNATITIISRRRKANDWVLGFIRSVSSAKQAAWLGLTLLDPKLDNLEEE